MSGQFLGLNRWYFCNKDSFLVEIIDFSHASSSLGSEVKWKGLLIRKVMNDAVSLMPIFIVKSNWKKARQGVTLN